MGFLIFALLIIITFTALAIERILKDIRSQNKEIIELLSKADENKNNKLE
ncbi:MULTISPECIES: hypothetical protein [Solibacillus]|nr:hypothetical protein [Solibacillus isronensis]MCM3720863.1 hypothetical protein [Solibacillus isronensis]